MFQKAYAKASGFTWPVVISVRTVAGECKGALGTFVVLNKDGWILTAAHIVEGCFSLNSAAQATTSREVAVAAIRDDASISAKGRSSRLKALGKTKPGDVKNYSSWWNGSNLVDIHLISGVDLAIGRLDPFNPAMVPKYPCIKNHALNYAPGTSLCRLGYPLYEVPVSWDDATAGFTITPPFPLFPIEGMLTRFYHDQKWPLGQYPFELLQIETSSPGLIGQSGGPIFDVEGRVWAIQSRTAHHALGFDPEVTTPEGQKHREHQFLNAGLGVHAATIVGLLAQHGVDFDQSAD